MLKRGAAVDEIFVIEPPDAPARAEILWVQVKPVGADPDSIDLSGLARSSDGLTGEELRRAVYFAALDAMRERRPLATGHVARALAGQQPAEAARASWGPQLALARQFALPA